MASRARRGIVTMSVAVAAVFSAGVAVATQVTASANGAPTCGAAAGHHCLALTNYTSDKVEVRVDQPDSAGQKYELVGCYTLQGKQRRTFSGAAIRNGAEIRVSFLPKTAEAPSSADTCLDFSTYESARYTKVDQSTTYEWVDIMAGADGKYDIRG